MIKNYIFLGPPGVGKGTLAQELAKKQGLVHVSTGEMFRQEIKKQTSLGQKIASLVRAGDYVPDDLTNQIVKNFLLSPKVKHQGFILDGYPRTINQAQFLKENGFKIDCVLLLQAPMEIILKRILNRQRQDDNPLIVSQRIEIYNQKTKPLIDYYQSQKLLKTIDASGNIKQNWTNFLAQTKQT